MTGITAQLDGASNVLLKAPSMAGGRDHCSTLLTGDLENPSVLFVSFTRQGAACIEQWEATGESAANLGVITVGDTAAGVDRDDVVTESVSSASDLTGLGIAIGQTLGKWSPPVVVCFDSLTSMLQYVDFETAYEFLHAITGQLHAADARAHFHIDPDAHDEHQVEGITSLFDALVEGSDEPTVRTRAIME